MDSVKREILKKIYQKSVTYTLEDQERVDETLEVKEKEIWKGTNNLLTHRVIKRGKGGMKSKWKREM